MLTVSKDRKVTNLPNKSGTAPLFGNAFGLPAGDSCPGMTTFCQKICYAGRTERQYKGVDALVWRNYQALLYADYLDGIEGMVSEISPMIDKFRMESEKRNAPLYFRIHWDGDFFSLAYANAWANVCKANPDIDFWVYTRSFTDTLNVLPALVGIANLTVYLSADPVNVDLAKTMGEKYNLPIALVADTFDEAKASLDAKAYNCPENKRTLPLITDKGSACGRCGVCPSGRGNVLFSVTKR